MANEKKNRGTDELCSFLKKKQSSQKAAKKSKHGEY